MVSKEITEKVIALIESGTRSSDIAKKLKISVQTVQGIKAHLTLKNRTSKDLNILTRSNHNYKLEASTVEAKSKAIINGYFLRNSISNPTNDELKSSLKDLSLLIAQLTSPSKIVRDSAKQSVKQLVNNDEDKTQTSSNEEITSAESPAAQMESNRGKRWTQAEQASLIKAWGDLSSTRDAMTVRQLSAKHDRTELAIITRLFQASLITMAQGDELCIASQTPILISERFTPNNTSPKSNPPLIQTNKSLSTIQVVSTKEHDNSEKVRLCVECFQSIPQARLLVSPYTYHCTKCLSRLEKRIDYHQYIDEGLAGTREEHKHIRGRNWR